jgi:hypothetical protein
MGVLSSHVESSLIVDLVRHVIRTNPEILLHLRYFACSRRRADINERNLQDQILELLIATATDDDNESILRNLIQSGRYIPEDLKTFLTLHEKMPVERFHRVLMGVAYMNEGFVNTLVDWLQLEGGNSPG